MQRLGGNRTTYERKESVEDGGPLGLAAGAELVEIAIPGESWEKKSSNSNPMEDEVVADSEGAGREEGAEVKGTAA